MPKQIGMLMLVMKSLVLSCKFVARMIISGTISMIRIIIGNHALIQKETVMKKISERIIITIFPIVPK